MKRFKQIAFLFQFGIAFALLLGLLFSNQLQAQSTYSSEDAVELCTTHGGGNAQAAIIFQVQNTNSFPIEVNGIKVQMGTSSGAAGTYNFKLLYNSTAITTSGGSWTAGAVGEGVSGWESAGTQTTTLTAHSSPQVVMDELSLEVPAGATYSICLTVQTGSIGYETLTSGAGVNTFTADGVNILTGDNISWGSSSAYTGSVTPGFHPRGFYGCLIISIPDQCEPKAVIAASTDVDEVCGGEDIHIAVVSDLGDCTYSWIGPDGFTSTDSAFTLTETVSSMSGWYYVTVTSSGECISSDSVQITVHPHPGAVTLSATTDTLCPGDATVITASSSTSEAIFTWFPSGGLESGDRNQTYTVAPTVNFSSYTAVAVTEAGCTSTSSDTIRVTVDPIPTGITYTHVTAYGVHDGTYTISGLIPGVHYRVTHLRDGDPFTSPIAPATEEGTYTVYGVYPGEITEVFVKRMSNECLSLTPYKFTMEEPENPNDPSALDEDIVEAYLKVYPNPTSDLLYIQVSDYSANTKIQLTDLNGRVLKEIDQVSGSELSINLQDYAAGIYFIKYIDADKLHIVKVTKQ